jgi:hypothetical protein
MRIGKILFLKYIPQMLRDRDGTVLASRAADADHQLAFAFALVMGQRKLPEKSISLSINSFVSL